MKLRIDIIIILCVMGLPVLGSDIIPSELDTTIARSRIAKAVEYRNSFKYDSSSICYEKARQIYHELAERNNPDLWGKVVHCMNEIGYNHRHLGTYEQGMKIQSILVNSRKKLQQLKNEGGSRFKKARKAKEILNEQSEQIEALLSVEQKELYREYKKQRKEQMKKRRKD